MRLIGRHQVYLEKGEIVPYFCLCGFTYQPPAASFNSYCPECGRLNDHDDQEPVLTLGGNVRPKEPVH